MILANKLKSVILIIHFSGFFESSENLGRILYMFTYFLILQSPNYFRIQLALANWIFDVVLFNMSHVIWHYGQVQYREVEITSKRLYGTTYCTNIGSSEQN